MSAVPQDEQPYLDKRDLKGWPNSTADLLMHVVNELGAKYRAIDGGHILLYPPDGVSRPRKLSASAQVENNAKHVARFIREHASKQQARWEREQEAARKLAKDQEDLRLQRAAAEAEVRRAEMAAVATTEEEDLDEAPAIEGMKFRTLTKGRHYAVTLRGEKRESIETDGETYWCLVTECDFSSHDIRGVGAHQRTTHLQVGIAVEGNKEKAREAQRARHAARVQARRDAVQILADAVGWQPDNRELAKLRKQVEALTEKVEKLTAERDDAKAKLTTIKEAMK